MIEDYIGYTIDIVENEGRRSLVLDQNGDPFILKSSYQVGFRLKAKENENSSKR